ncbi:hypothetical protein N7475_004315 [Penicillium sp. IBT 31633x]|nr:hypothetical protein N7475_004315 [Penicillium sp. IBT 31633x]
MDKTEQHVELTDRLHELSSREGRLSAVLKANQISVRDLNEEVRMLESVLMADAGFVIANLEEKLAILEGLQEQGA